jgi:hypothetical protein
MQTNGSFQSISFDKYLWNPQSVSRIRRLLVRKIGSISSAVITHLDSSYSENKVKLEYRDSKIKPFSESQVTRAVYHIDFLPSNTYFRIAVRGKGLIDTALLIQ